MTMVLPARRLLRQSPKRSLRCRYGCFLVGLFRKFVILWRFRNEHLKSPSNARRPRRAPPRPEAIGLVGTFGTFGLSFRMKLGAAREPYGRFKAFARCRRMSCYCRAAFHRAESNAAPAFSLTSQKQKTARTVGCFLKPCPSPSGKGARKPGLDQ